MKKGSALLIVLGMMAFMIVSAVAFSAYMRYSRLPSSYLRRAAASRHLVKSALARAIDEIDLAVANNPHPGVGNEYIGRQRNYWKHRVYIGANTLRSADATAPVLTLEGLAYIPPPLVNEARYYSRRSAAGEWKSFGFDAGRYAFCALDVSDYFDVNRLTANTARSSASGRRISLAYLFEDASHTSPGSAASQWDETFMKQFRDEAADGLGFDYANKVPLTSLCDLNLALGSQTFGDIKSYFYSYIRDGRSNFYNGEVDKAVKMTFVTDSYFPPESPEAEEEQSDYSELYDLADGQYQPFTYDQLREGNRTTLMDIVGRSGRLNDSLSTLGMAALFDYLDEDRVPISLAIPTVERAPMCVALKPGFDSSALRIEADASDVCGNEDCTSPAPTTGPAGGTDQVYVKVSYTIDGQKFAEGLGAGIKSVFAYPFAHEDAISGENFKVDGKMALFFTLDGDPMGLRSSADDALHIANTGELTSANPTLKDGILNIPFGAAQQLDLKSQNRDSEEDAVKELSIDTRGARGVASTLGQTPVMEVTYTWTRTWQANPNTGILTPTPNTLEAAQAAGAGCGFGVAKAHCGLPPLSSRGVVRPEYANDNQFRDLINAGNGGAASLNLALWVRVTDKNSKTVDLVPASVLDDKTFNNIDNDRIVTRVDHPNSSWPVMRFGTGIRIRYDSEWMEDTGATEQPLQLSPAAVKVDDPRFNHAPESWYQAANATANDWLNNTTAPDRDGDIFLATSDQGYLQSIYELALIPSLGTRLDAKGDATTGHYARPDGRSEFAANAGGALNSGIMWKTYCAYDCGSGSADDFEGCGFTSAGTGFKVNPYSDQTNVVMAAFANTPVDWRMASTNNQEEALEDLSAQEFNSQYAWNAMQSDTRIEYAKLEAIAGAFMDKMRGRDTTGDEGVPEPSGGRADWKAAFDDLDWEGQNESDFCGVNLGSTKLWSADRSFLYGFWRDCFAARQQLFLIFVRAEPLMMGGGMMSRIPPQLGGRAVALVWRDPTATSGNVSNAGESGSGYPHRTRILFYKQLE